ncbi:MAG: SCP2 sterol-binding domain-containing protein [Smithellaceae bacterium]|nr:SCP2 sterol-binding domain-containing protein [Smithellaceae bacterium]
MQNEEVLARIHLNAVLSNLEILAREDAEASSIAGAWNGGILLTVGLQGPKVTLEMRQGAVRVEPGRTGNPGIVLFFPTARMLNNLFTGAGRVFPIPVKGLFRIRGLKAFAALAKRMEAVLKGADASRKLKARLLLNTVGRTVAVLAASEPESRKAAFGLRGVAELRIKDSEAVHITFTGQSATAASGHAPDPDLVMEFASEDVFLDLTEDKVDVFAAICLEDIRIQGDLHMGDVVNGLLDRVGVYLQ